MLNFETDFMGVINKRRDKPYSICKTNLINQIGLKL